MNAGGRHAFWSVPAFMPRSLRTEPIRVGGRYVGMGGSIFMGQTPQSLESLSIPAIQNRILATPLIEKLQTELTNSGTSLFPGDFRRAQSDADVNRALQTSLLILTDPEKALIRSISQNPSSEELDDLQVIDGFFSVVPGGQNIYQMERSLTPELCDLMNGRGRSAFVGRNQKMSLAQAVWDRINYTTPGRFATKLVSDQDIDQIRQNPFFCATPKEFPSVVYGRDKADYAGWFGIDPNQAWGAAKVQVQNAITVMDVVSSYPFPPPIDLEDKAAFWILSIGEIQQIVHAPEPVDPEVVRYWITMTILANYSAWVDRIVQDAKQKAKKAKRKMIMTTIGLAVASLVAVFLLPAVIALTVSAIKTAVTAYTDAQKRKKAARDMADAAKMFADDAPAFSKEVDHAAQMLDEQAAREQAAATPSPDIQAAIQEVNANTGPAWGTILPVGGGIAAAGLAVFAIFR